jgi:hypothetical protein
MPEDHLLRPKIREITFDDFPDTLMRIAFAIYYHRYIPMDIGIHLSFSRSFLVALVVTRCLEIFSVVPRILWVTALQFFPHKNLTVISSHLSRIRSSQLLMCLTKSFEMLFDLPKILCSPLLLNFLPAGIMVNSICLVVFIDIPCLCHFKPNDSMCAYARDHQDILLNYLSDSDVLPDMSWFSTIRTFNDCLAKSFSLSILDQSVCFWSFVWKS